MTGSFCGVAAGAAAAGQVEPQPVQAFVLAVLAAAAARRRYRVLDRTDPLRPGRKDPERAFCRVPVALAAGVHPHSIFQRSPRSARPAELKSGGRIVSLKVSFLDVSLRIGPDNGTERRV